MKRLNWEEKTRMFLSGREQLYSVVSIQLPDTEQEPLINELIEYLRFIEVLNPPNYEAKKNVMKDLLLTAEEWEYTQKYFKTIRTDIQLYHIRCRDDDEEQGAPVHPV